MNLPSRGRHGPARDVADLVRLQQQRPRHVSGYEYADRPGESEPEHFGHASRLGDGRAGGLRMQVKLEPSTKSMHRARRRLYDVRNPNPPD